MESFSIQSLNCQGLGYLNKRKDVFNHLHNKKYNIVCLQDTHFTTSQENNIESLWGCRCYTNSFVTNSKGVAILKISLNLQYIVNQRLWMQLLGS